MGWLVNRHLQALAEPRSQQQHAVAASHPALHEGSIRILGWRDPREAPSSSQHWWAAARALQLGCAGVPAALCCQQHQHQQRQQQRQQEPGVAAWHVTCRTTPLCRGVLQGSVASRAGCAHWARTEPGCSGSCSQGSPCGTETWPLCLLRQTLCTLCTPSSLLCAPCLRATCLNILMHIGLSAITPHDLSQAWYSGRIKQLSTGADAAPLQSRSKLGPVSARRLLVQLRRVLAAHQAAAAAGWRPATQPEPQQKPRARTKRRDAPRLTDVSALAGSQHQAAAGTAGAAESKQLDWGAVDIQTILTADPCVLMVRMLDSVLHSPLL